MSDYVMLMHPWARLKFLWMMSLSEGPYSFVWKAENDQTYADWQGWGINDHL